MKVIACTGLPVIIGIIGLGIVEIFNWQAEKVYNVEYWERQFRILKEYSALGENLAREILAKKRTLTEGALEVMHFRNQTGFNPVPYLRVFYSLIDDEACLAAQLAQRVAYLLADQPAHIRQQHLENLSLQFEVYHPSLPPMVREKFQNPI